MSEIFISSDVILIQALKLKMKLTTTISGKSLHVGYTTYPLMLQNWMGAWLVRSENMNGQIPC